MKFFLSLLLLIPLSASGQCFERTGNNASIFIMKDGAPSLDTGTIRAYGNAGCVGEATLVDSDALAYSLTVWGDNEITPEPDGLAPGEPIQLMVGYRTASEAPFRSSLTYAPDALYKIEALTFSPVLDSLIEATASLQTAFDSLVVADSIKSAVYDSTLAAERAQFNDLESESRTAIDQIERLTAFLRSITGERYREIEAILNP